MASDLINAVFENSFKANFEWFMNMRMGM